MTQILKLDSTGFPCEWLTRRDAIFYHSQGDVLYEIGGEDDAATVTFRGGMNRITGQQSKITTAPIIAIRGETGGRRKAKTPALNNPNLFARDRYLCAYCGFQFKSHQLSCDHIHPRSKGGEDKWMNVVTACLDCNNRKADYTLDEAGMKLLYAPYVPNFAEEMILRNRNILECQMDYLLKFVSKDFLKRYPDGVEVAA